jgi:hypothetical protein
MSHDARNFMACFSLDGSRLCGEVAFPALRSLARRHLQIFQLGGFGCVKSLVGGLERVGELGYNCSLGLEF